MFFESLAHAKAYYWNNPAFINALNTIQSYSQNPFQTGRWDIDGENMYMVAAEYRTSALTIDSQMEAHRKYIDIMYMLEGEECIFCKPTSKLNNITSSFNQEKDFLLADVDADVIPNALRKGQVAVLLPEDAHCPGCNLDGEKSVRKLICKLAVEFAQP